jgi:diacylglycerol kinase (ATP)
METREKILFIINPASGTKKRKGIEKLIAGYLDREKFDYIIRYVEGKGHAYELAREAVSLGYPAVVAVGGDGSVNLVAKALFGTSTKLGIIPYGSGNGLARFLNIPLNPVKALQVINAHHSRMIDTASVNGEFFISIAGIGFDARIADLFARQGRRGFISYFRLVLKEFFSYLPKKYFLQVGEDIHSFEAFFVSFANSNQFGYNTTIAPEASIDDGLLDICIVAKPPLIKIPWVAYKIFTGQFNKIQYIRVLKAGSFRLVQNESEIVNIDGDPFIIGHDLTVSVNPLSLEVVIPNISKP